MNINSQLLAEVNNKMDYLIIGHNATSYRLPLIVELMKEYEGKICVQTKNIKGKYIVFDKNTFLDALKIYQGENNNTNDNEKKT
jgi:hypothetical protein